MKGGDNEEKKGWKREGKGKRERGEGQQKRSPQFTLLATPLLKALCVAVQCV